MGILIIIRHGFSESNKKGYLTHDIEGYPLTAEGKEYLIKSAEELKKLDDIKEIISSPIQRARETAEIVSHATGVKMRIDPRLAERQMGNYNNKPIPNENKIETEVKGLENRLNEKFETKIDALDKKFESKINALDKRLTFGFTTILAVLAVLVALHFIGR